MDFAIKLPSIFCVSSIILIMSQCAAADVGSTPRKFPCMFVFGDSLVDNGNNNWLTTDYKVDFLPYGIDHPQGPTGRYTNGRNTADILASLLGFSSSIPPYTLAQGRDIITGINYASGTAGIRNETGKPLGDNISMDKQLLNHMFTVSRISDLLGNDTLAKNHLSQCLYYVVVGNNDYIHNYYLPENYPTMSALYNPDRYATLLVQQYSHQLKTLYSYGARKVSVSGLAPLGCLPKSLARGTNGSICVTPINDAVKLFNQKLERMVEKLNHNLTDAKFIYNSAMALEPNALITIGMRFVSKPCCKVSNTTGMCIKGQRPCPNRHLYAFYDAIHPTETVNKYFAGASYIAILRKMFG